MIRRTLLLAVALAAAPALAQDLRVSDRPIDPDEVPPGTKEDQQLYFSLRSGTAELMKEMRGANESLHTAKLAFANLDVVAKGAAPDEAKRIGELRTRLQRSVEGVLAATPKKPLAGCRYTLLHLEDSMIAEPGTAPAKRLPQKRAEAQACDRDIRATLPGLKAAAAELKDTIAEIAPEIRRRREAYEAELAKGAPAAAATAPSPGPSPAAAQPAAPVPPAKK
jgi:hypothetical protein